MSMEQHLFFIISCCFASYLKPFGRRGRVTLGVTSRAVLIKSRVHPVRDGVQMPPSPRRDRGPVVSRLVSKPRPISGATTWVWDESGLQSVTLVFKERRKPHMMFTDNNKPSKPKGGNFNRAIGVISLHLEIIIYGRVKLPCPTPLPPRNKIHFIRNTKMTEAPVVVEKCAAYRDKLKLLRLFFLFYFTAQWSRIEIRGLQGSPSRMRSTIKIPTFRNFRI